MSNGRKIVGPKIGDIVELTAASGYLDAQCIRHFVDELYDERNITLHGRTSPEGSPIHAARELAVLEYLLDIIGTTYEDRFVRYMDDLYEELIRHLLDQFEQRVSS